MLDATTPIRSIVYVSTAVQNMTAEELEALLVDSRDSNLDTNTTGVLLYSDGKFMQCFEGTEEGVRFTYDRIIKSSQHRDIVELMNGNVPNRSFKDWQMGFAQPTSSELLSISTANWELQDLWARGWQVSPGMKLLQLFWSRAG